MHTRGGGGIPGPTAATTFCYAAGLMDAGVGCFVLASAIPAGVSAAGRGAAKARRRPSKQAAQVGILAALGAGRRHAAVSISQPCALGWLAAGAIRSGEQPAEKAHLRPHTAGLGRALATRSLDYQAHVGEYGVHWNFFLTLAVLRLANLALARCASSTVAAGVEAAWPAWRNAPVHASRATTNAALRPGGAV